MTGKCPYRPELSLPDMPESMRKLKIDARGYPIPAFVDYVNGEPEFRAMNGQHLVRCVREKLCWVCAEPLHRNALGFPSTIAFLVGPMCAVNRISAEPPSHPDCAEWSARNCPFLARPHMKRRQDEFINDSTLTGGPGFAITRNPGVSLVWPTDGFRLIKHRGGALFHMNLLTTAPTWWAEGRPATRAEILHSIETGLPFLEAAIDAEPPESRENSRAMLKRQTDIALQLVPA